jgi:hypothetical protein
VTTGSVATSRQMLHSNAPSRSPASRPSSFPAGTSHGAHVGSASPANGPRSPAGGFPARGASCDCNPSLRAERRRVPNAADIRLDAVRRALATMRGVNAILPCLSF